MADPVVNIDYIDNVECSERWGVLERLVRVARVTGLTGTDYTILYSVLEAAGIPAANTHLDDDHPYLMLADRGVKMIDKDKADVTLTYERFNDKGQPLDYATETVGLQNVAGKMSTTITQKESNLYGPGGNDPIILNHTYPDDDKDYANQYKEQTGMINVQIPQRTFTIEGVKETDAPWDIADSLIGTINDEIWLGKPKGTWMCTEVGWEFRKDGVYFMTFTFQNDEDGWQPVAVFIDDRTNRPPIGLVWGDGIQRIDYFTEKNFPSELGFIVVGPAQV